MYKKTIRNERGDLSFFTIFIILAIVMLMSFLLLFASMPIPSTHRGKPTLTPIWQTCI